MFKKIAKFAFTPLKRRLVLHHSRNGYATLIKRGESGGSSFLKDDHPPKSITLQPLSKYGGESSVTLLTGPTMVGKQGASYIKTLFDTMKVPVAFEKIEVGAKNSRPNEYVMSVMRNRTAIHVDLQHDPDEKKKSLQLNNDLDLYASVIKMHSFQGFNCKFPKLDITVIIQNNTGDYTKLEYEPVPGIVETLCIHSDEDVRRYIEFSFNYAVRHCRTKITFGHKSKKFPKYDGRFLQIATEIHCTRFPQVEIEFMEINKMLLNLVMNPQIFDMICTNDRYGTFVASTCSAVCGGAALFSAIELGDTHAVFKPLQTKLSVSDCRVLSPYGIVRACVDLLIHLGNTECAHLMWHELLRTMLVKKIKTAEFGGTASGEFVICDMVNNLKCKFA